MSLTDAVGPLGAVRELKESDFFPRKQHCYMKPLGLGFLNTFFFLKIFFLFFKMEC